MKQRIASVVMALGLALGMVVVAEAPASAATVCRTNMHVIYSGTTKIVRVDNDGCFRVQGTVRIKAANNQALTYKSSYIYGVGTSLVYLPAGSTIKSMTSEVRVTPIVPVPRILTWAASPSFQWRTLSQ